MRTRDLLPRGGEAALALGLWWSPHTHHGMGSVGNTELHLFSWSMFHLLGSYYLPPQKSDVLPQAIMVNSRRKGLHPVQLLLLSSAPSQFTERFGTRPLPLPVRRLHKGHGQVPFCFPWKSTLLQSHQPEPSVSGVGAPAPARLSGLGSLVGSTPIGDRVPSTPSVSSLLGGDLAALESSVQYLCIPISETSGRVEKAK